MEHSMGLFLGMVAGLIVGIALVALLFKKKVIDCTFDERQERARGAAYKYGFFTLMIAVALHGISVQFLGRWCDPLAGAMLCVCLAAGVFATVCIWKDAYLSLREKPRKVMTLFAVLSAVNLAIGGLYIADGTLVRDGVVTFRAVNPMVGLMMLVILAVYAVNYALREREAE